MRLGLAALALVVGIVGYVSMANDQTLLGAGLYAGAAALAIVTIQMGRRGG